MGSACGRWCDHPTRVLLGCFLHFNLWTTQPNAHTTQRMLLVSFSLTGQSVHSRACSFVVWQVGVGAYLWAPARPSELNEKLSHQPSHNHNPVTAHRKPHPDFQGSNTHTPLWPVCCCVTPGSHPCHHTWTCVPSRCALPQRAAWHHALVVAHCMEAHRVVPRGWTCYYAPVFSCWRDSTAEGVQ